MVVYVTHNYSEAHIVAGRLQSEGIPAMVNQALGANAFGLTIGSIGEVKVLVHPENYEIALHILFPEEHDTLTDNTDRIIFDPRDLPDERDLDDDFLDE
ncbi:MAG: hypothetical protein D6737_20665 [Chloroflexi bacterium]|nr:MAG: hypothetical protein D6737_20665 [Chloroflexota bacterium]